MLRIGLLVVAAVASAQPSEKLLLGYEREELERGREIATNPKARPGLFEIVEQESGFNFCARFEGPGSHAWRWYCRPGERTQGEIALVSEAYPPSTNRELFFAESDFLSYYYPFVKHAERASVVAPSWTWIPISRPDLRDWRGWDVLRVDILPEGAPAKVWLAVEDNLIEPPVMRTYEAPDRRWVTLEVDLRQAARERDLDLSNMTTFWLIARPTRATNMLVDNWRLCRRDAAAALPVLRDENSMTYRVQLPPRPLQPERGALPEPDRSPIGPEEPSVVGEGIVTPVGWIAAYDNRRMFVGFLSKGAQACQTRDGGKSWEALEGPILGNPDHGSARGWAIDPVGDGAFLSSGWGCVGVGGVSPRQTLTKYTFTSNGWVSRKPDILDADIRHCGSTGHVIRLPGGRYAGRLWAVWGEVDRERRHGVHAKFSDDDGRTWHAWGKGALLPGSREEEPGNTYYFPGAAATPYRDHVAVFWRQISGTGVLWSVYDGKAWSKPAEVCSNKLNHMDGAYRDTITPVTVGSNEIYVTALDLGAVHHFDGRRWRKEKFQPQGDGMLSLTGDTLTYFTAGEAYTKWHGRGYVRTNAQLLYYHKRLPDGRWQGPVRLTEPFLMPEHRSIEGFSVPLYSPPNFVPLAWCEVQGEKRVIKVLRVSVPR